MLVSLIAEDSVDSVRGYWRRRTLYALGDLEEDFILAEAWAVSCVEEGRGEGGRGTVGVMIAAESNPGLDGWLAILVLERGTYEHDESVFFGEDGLVDVPGCAEVREDETHVGSEGSCNGKWMMKRKLKL